MPRNAETILLSFAREKFLNVLLFLTVSKDKKNICGGRQKICDNTYLLLLIESSKSHHISLEPSDKMKNYRKNNELHN